MRVFFYFILFRSLLIQNVEHRIKCLRSQLRDLQLETLKDARVNAIRKR